MGISHTKAASGAERYILGFIRFMFLRMFRAKTPPDIKILESRSRRFYQVPESTGLRLHPDLSTSDMR